MRDLQIYITTCDPSVTRINFQSSFSEANFNWIT